MIIAEVAIFPTSEGTSVSRYVKRALQVLEDSGLDYESSAMATCIQADTLPDIFDVVTRMHEAIQEMGAERIHIDLRVDHRRDKDATMQSKLKAIGKDQA
ncbi:MAG: MTH1187 family thiamine-binding protein [Thermoplasmatota archaeon]